MAARMGFCSHVLSSAATAAGRRAPWRRRLLLPPPPPVFLRLQQQQQRHYVHMSTQAQAATAAAAGQAETVAAAPRYPPVLPSLTAMSKIATARRRQEARARVRAAPSAAEKIDMLSRVQQLKYIVSPLTFALNADRPYQHFTKSAFVQRLPESLAMPAAASSPLLDRARDLVKDALLQEFAFVRRQRGPLYREQRHVVEAFVTTMVSRLVALLAQSSPALGEAFVDLKPDVGFYWWRGERTVVRGHRSGKVEPIRFQIEDKPINQIRMQQQLPEFIPIDSDLSIDEVPTYTKEPSHLPLFRRQYKNKIFTGAKINDPHRYGHTQFHVTADRLSPKHLAAKGIAEQVEVRLRAHAIASLFAWTGAQAMYQGFWADEDLTRPFVSHAVITDGLHFSFFCYQLNTLALDTHTDGGNVRRNVCWGTPSVRLYDAIEGSQVHGFNEEVVTTLVRLLLNQPLNPALPGQVAETATTAGTITPGVGREGPTTSG